MNSGKAQGNHVHTVIVGAGFGGLCMGIKLREAGVEDFVILEKGSEVGGTWRDNQYPGAACDVQSHLYSYSFAPKSDWSQRYAGWAEIQQYILDVTERFDMRSRIRFGREVNSAVFDESSGQWTIGTSSGETYVCRHWVLASGPLHVPAYPDIKGLDTFKGKIIHSARWDKSYDFSGKRVASLGSGGSAIQYVPEIAPTCGKLHVFQRTPAWVIQRDERTYPEWRKKLFGALPFLRTLHRWRLYWGNESRVWPLFTPALARLWQRRVLSIMRRQVSDSALFKKMVPGYTIGCKRVLISNKWLPTFNRPNVELVTDGIVEIREHSIVTTDGKERDIECLVLGTGFVTDPRLYMKEFTLLGLGGRRLQDDWAKTPTAYLGVSVAGYPNMFQLVGPHSALGHNSIIFMIEAQVRHILTCMEEAKRRSAAWVAVKPEAQFKFLNWVSDQLQGTVWTSGCRAWYQTAEGVNFTIWPGSTWAYWLACRRLKSADFEFGGLAK
jgi:cation diffusion facilitator CzcD-associated flavoprotein CzcO